jgi:hypothetical protein
VDVLVVVAVLGGSEVLTAAAEHEDLEPGLSDG